MLYSKFNMTAKSTFIILIAALMVLSFQNCSQMGSEAAGSASEKETVIESTSKFKSLVYGPLLETSFPDDATVELDLESGQVSIEKRSLPTVLCVLDSTRLAKARGLLGESQICKPAPVNCGDANPCMGWTWADIELSDESKSVLLGSSNTLCNGNTDKLRALLESIKATPPPGCAR